MSYLKSSHADFFMRGERDQKQRQRSDKRSYQDIVLNFCMLTIQNLFFLPSRFGDHHFRAISGELIPELLALQGNFGIILDIVILLGRKRDGRMPWRRETRTAEKIPLEKCGITGGQTWRGQTQNAARSC